jgi:sulfoxide reductase heme-binding subunit YedZ
MMSVTRRYQLFVKPAIWVAALVPMLLMISGISGVGGYHLGANPVREVLHQSGKTAINLLLITLAVSPLRQLTGWTHLLRVRRLLGVFAFFYAALHFMIYLSLDLRFDLMGLLKDLSKRPYITVGFAAVLILTALAATSTQKMMRRLGKRWQSLHRFVYAAGLLAVWHFWWQVKKDITEPLLYAGMLAILLGWRLWKRRATTLRSAPATVPERT